MEERDGYWVLKEEYRAGINPQEKVKLERDPMKLVLEDGIKELAAMPMEDIDGSKISKDDIDVRLKWLGLFHRRKHQCELLSLSLSFSLSWISGSLFCRFRFLCYYLSFKGLNAKF